MTNEPNKDDIVTLTSRSVLNEDGQISARLKSYESRPEQVQMAEAVEAVIADKEHLIVEAGTGVGKSFAYLVPAILAASASDRSKNERTRVVVSTQTINLQETVDRKGYSISQRGFTSGIFCRVGKRSIKLHEFATNESCL